MSLELLNIFKNSILGLHEMMKIANFNHFTMDLYHFNSALHSIDSFQQLSNLQSQGTTNLSELNSVLQQSLLKSIIIILTYGKIDFGQNQDLLNQLIIQKQLRLIFIGIDKMFDYKACEGIRNSEIITAYPSEHVIIMTLLKSIQQLSNPGIELLEKINSTDFYKKQDSRFLNILSLIAQCEDAHQLVQSYQIQDSDFCVLEKRFSDWNWLFKNTNWVEQFESIEQFENKKNISIDAQMKNIKILIDSLGSTSSIISSTQLDFNPVDLVILPIQRLTFSPFSKINIFDSNVISNELLEKLSFKQNLGLVQLNKLQQHLLSDTSFKSKFRQLFDFQIQQRIQNYNTFISSYNQSLIFDYDQQILPIDTNKQMQLISSPCQLIGQIHSQPPLKNFQLQLQKQESETLTQMNSQCITLQQKTNQTYFQNHSFFFEDPILMTPVNFNDEILILTTCRHLFDIKNLSWFVNESTQCPLCKTPYLPTNLAFIQIQNSNLIKDKSCLKCNQDTHFNFKLDFSNKTPIRQIPFNTIVKTPFNSIPVFQIHLNQLLICTQCIQL